jgi:hypothetical protein
LVCCFLDVRMKCPMAFSVISPVICLVYYIFTSMRDIATNLYFYWKRFMPTVSLTSSYSVPFHKVGM